MRIHQEDDLGCISVTTTNHCLAIFSGITVRECRNMLAVLIQNAFVGMATSSDDAKMLLNIPFPMNHVIIDLLALNFS